MRAVAIICVLLFAARAFAAAPAPVAQAAPVFKVLAFYSLSAEKAHVEFAKLAIDFYTKLGAEKNFAFTATTDWSECNTVELKKYDVVVWLDDQPHNAEQQKAFQDYMENGGAWLGHHVAAFNTAGFRWQWFVKFIGGAVFYCNSWPPSPAKLIVDTHDNVITKDLPAMYVSPANEFYQWVPSPRSDKDVVVLATVDPAIYPLGKKDLLTEGDVPVVWSNTKYKMIYINMGHGDKILTDATQNAFIVNCLMWLGDKHGPKLTAAGISPATQPVTK